MFKMHGMMFLIGSMSKDTIGVHRMMRIVII